MCLLAIPHFEKTGNVSLCSLFSIATVCLLAIPHFEKTGDFSYPLPNMMNVSFYPAVVLKMALVIVPLSTYVKLKFLETTCR